MSISPPSDIVLDVAQAADPQRVEAATARLAALAAGGGGPADFGAALAGAAPRGAGALPPARAPDLSALRPDHAGPGPALSPYQKFEAVLMSTLVGEMLPKDDDLFGDRASADSYRGMMADQLAEALARSGRLGIARALEKAHPAAPPAAHPAPPADPA